ncbi:MAG: regulatory protein RecX [Actinomycetaceae bacterium]|nr:regulatory protein RecX [Actinomycetaceae bacterium]
MVYYGDELDRPRRRRDPGAAARRREERRQWAASLTGDEAVAAAKDVALRFLDRQDRSVGQCRDKLRERGFAEDAIEQALGRLVEIDVLNDERYARMLVRTRHRERGLVGRALIEQLRQKKIPSEIIERAMTEVDDESGETIARDLVRRRLRSIGDVSREKQFRRLVSMLARKGYPPSVSIGIVTSVLEEEQVDE